jgi:hypothetical protein
MYDNSDLIITKLSNAIKKAKQNDGERRTEDQP